MSSTTTSPAAYWTDSIEPDWIKLEEEYILWLKEMTPAKFYDLYFCTPFSLKEENKNV